MIVTIGGIPVYNAIISDAETGMFKISLVDDPAVMSNFQAFDKQNIPQMYAIQDEEKRLVRGVVMRADFPIYRIDDKMGEYYIIYKADQIRIMAEKYLAESRQNDVNVMHRKDSDVNGVQMVQYFIKGDGVSVEGFDECADGSLFAEFHIINDDIWDEIKAGTYKGFSLEGVFDMQPETDADEIQDIVNKLDGAFRKLFKNNNNKIMSKLKKLKAALAKAFAALGNVTTDKGILAWDGYEDLKAGYKIYVEDAEGNRTPAEDGDYRTEDGKTIVVVGGQVAEIKDPEAEVDSNPVAVPVRPVPAVMETITTDKGELSYNGELAVGTEVFVVGENGESIPAEDGDYKVDSKTIKVVDGKVSEIVEDAPVSEPASEPAAESAEIAELKAQIKELKAQIEKMSKMSAAKPAHQEVVQSIEMGKTGIKRLDNLAKFLSAK